MAKEKHPAGPVEEYLDEYTVPAGLPEAAKAAGMLLALDRPWRQIKRPNPSYQFAKCQHGDRADVLQLTRISLKTNSGILCYLVGECRLCGYHLWCHAG